MYGYGIESVQCYSKRPLEDIFEVDDAQKIARLDTNLFVDGALVPKTMTVQNAEGTAA
jgi:hypothetical protein